MSVIGAGQDHVFNWLIGVHTQHPRMAIGLAVRFQFASPDTVGIRAEKAADVAPSAGSANAGTAVVFASATVARNGRNSNAAISLAWSPSCSGLRGRQGHEIIRSALVDTASGGVIKRACAPHVARAFRQGVADGRQKCDWLLLRLGQTVNEEVLQRRPADANDGSLIDHKVRLVAILAEARTPVQRQPGFKDSLVGIGIQLHVPLVLHSAGAIAGVEVQCPDLGSQQLRFAIESRRHVPQAARGKKDYLFPWLDELSRESVRSRLELAAHRPLGRRESRAGD